MPVSPRITCLILHLRQSFYTLTFIFGEMFYQIAWLKLPACQTICQSCFPDPTQPTDRRLVLARRCNQLDILHNDPSYFTSEPDATNPCHLADPLKDFGEPIWPAAFLALRGKKNRWRLGTFGEARSCFFSLFCCCILFLTR